MANEKGLSSKTQNARAIQAAKITVRKPCTCGAARWFLCAYSCPGREIVAEYDCDACDDGQPSNSTWQTPTPASVAWVRAQHPHDTLIYLP